MGGDELAMMNAVATGPVTAAIDASSPQLQMFTSGVLAASQCGTSLNHAVLVVGYGKLHDVTFWLVKNSWGKQWGEGGYFKIERGSGGVGACGVLSQSSYPTVDPSRRLWYHSVPWGLVALGAIILIGIVSWVCKRQQQAQTARVSLPSAIPPGIAGTTARY